MQVRCPHCRNCIAMVDDASLADVACPSCGSQFSFFDDETATYQAGVTRRVAHFELLDRLGMGHFGTVWKARDTELDRTVAIKIPRKNQLDAEEMEQFLREARAAAQLRHPSIVSIHEVGRDGDTVYIVSDYVQGASLSDWLTGQQLTAREAAALCAKAARALHHAHEQGVIHRDLKPGNIMIDLEGEPHILDFGLAKREAGEITMTVDGKVLGTPAYMPPEQARGEGHYADRRSDVYSLGVVLFQLLTGELPFRGNARMLLVQILNDEPPGPRRLNASVPRDLETITLKCLEKDPARRYQSAAALAEDLECWLTRKPISARPVTRWERGVKWARRRPAIAALLTLVLLVSTIGFASVFLQWQRTQSALTKVQSEWKRAELARHQLSRKAADEAVARIEAEAKRREAEASKAEAERANKAAGHNAAILAMERGRSLFEQRVPDGSQGLLWFGRSVEYAPHDATQLHRLAWTNIIAWLPYTHSIRHYLPYQGHAEAVLYDPAGQWVATACDGRFVQLWDAATGNEIWSTPQLTGEPLCLAFSPDSTRLVVGFGLEEEYEKKGAGRVEMYDTASGKLVGNPLAHPRAVKAVAFFPDGQHFLTGSFDAQMRRFRTADQQPIGQPLKHSSPVTTIAFSPDGRRIAAAGYQRENGGPPEQVGFWDTATLARLPQTLKHPSAVRQVIWHPGGQQLATAGADSHLRTWSFPECAVLNAMSHTSSAVSGVAYSPDGRTLVSTGYDYQVRVWSAASGQPIGQPLLQNGYAYSVSFHPDGQSFVSSSAHGAKIHDLASLRLPREIKLPIDKPPLSAVFSPDGTVVAVWWRVQPEKGPRLETLQAFDTSTGEPLGPAVQTRAMRYSLAIRGDNQLMAAPCDGEKKVRVWRIADGKLLAELLHQDKTNCVTFSPDPHGRYIATGSDDDTARVWDGETFQPITEPLKHAWDVLSVAFHPSGKSLLTGTTSLFQCNQWDIETGEDLGRYSRGSGAIGGLLFTPDGKKYATGEYGTWNVRWFDTDTGEPVSRPLPHPTHVDRRLTITADGSLLATGCEDGRLRLWDVETGQRIGPDFVCQGGVKAVALIDRNGARELLGFDTNKTIRRWSLPPLGEGKEQRIRLWTNLLTGLFLDKFSGLQPMSGAHYARFNKELAEQGGPPLTLALTREQRIDWHRYTVEAGLKEKDHYGAAWHLGRWHALEPQRGELLRRRVNQLLIVDNWRDATEGFRQLTKAEPDNPQPLFDAALAAAAAGDWADYRSTCALLLEKHIATSEITTLEKLAWICKFGELAVSDLHLPLRLVDRALAEKPKSARFHNTRGTLLYRLGRCEEALVALDQAVRFRKQPNPTDCFALALIHARLGQAPESRQWQARAEELVAQLQIREPGPPKLQAWSSRAEIAVFRAEWSAAAATATSQP